MYIEVVGGDGASELIITEENDLLRDLKSIDDVVKKIVGSNEQIFDVLRRKNGVPQIHARLSGKKLMRVLINGDGAFSFHFPMYGLSPYVSLLFRCAGRLGCPLLLACLDKIEPFEVESVVDMLNDLVFDMRREASSKSFRKVVRKLVKAARRREKSLDAYIDALFARYSRMVVIRLDLSYEVGYFRGGRDLISGLIEAKADWVKLQRDLHMDRPVKSMLGFACKLEYAHLTGFHFHLLLFYHGSEHCYDINMAKSIGEYWHQVVTEGRGRYDNCNARKYPERGVGPISHGDTVKLLILKGVVAEYLTKVDYLKQLSPECGRTFFRGNMPKKRGHNRGRPRSIVSLFQ